MQKLFKSRLLMVVLLAGLASPCYAALSERCTVVLAQSAEQFSQIDAYRNGFNIDEVPEDAQRIFMDAEIEAMQDMYGLGTEVLKRGATRAQALKYIRDSNRDYNAQSDLPKELQEKAAKGAENAFMCGYDDQLNSL